jgi:hypothetical protein
MPVILALRRLRQEGHEFEASLGYLVKPCFKKERKKIQLCFLNEKVYNKVTSLSLSLSLSHTHTHTHTPHITLFSSSFHPQV